MAYLTESDILSLQENRDSKWQKDSFFPDTDSALEWCENQLLHREQPGVARQSNALPLAAMDILAAFDRREIALLESILEEARYSAGETIIREGDSADSLFLLASGSVSVYLRLTNGTRQRRLSAISPGLAFGELALLDGGTRSADVIADEPALCYILPIAKLNALTDLHPEIRTKLIFNIGRELSARLRRADAEIRALAE